MKDNLTHSHSLNYSTARGFGLLAVLVCWVPICFGQVNISDSIRIQTLITSSQQLEKTDPDSAFILARKALVLAQHQHLPLLINQANIRLGVLFRYQGELDSAKIYYTRALELSKQLNDSLAMAKTWHNLAILARKEGAYSKALRLELLSLHPIEKAKDSVLLGHIYAGLGNLYSVQENWDKALEYFQKSLELHQHTTNLRGQTRMLYNLGVTNYEKDELDQAESLIKESLVLAEKLDDQNAQANALNSLGIIQQERKRPKEARQFYERALLIQQALQDREGLLYTQLSLGDLHLASKDWGRAEEAFREALDLALYTGLKVEEVSAREGLIKALEQQGQLAAAMALLRLNDRLKDTLRDATTSERLLEMQEKYESDKKEQQNQLLLQENELKASQLEAKSESLLQRNVLLGVLGMLLLISVLLILNYRKRVQAEQLMASQREEINNQKMLDLVREQELAYVNATLIGQETERNRIAADLHDGLSNMLVTVKLHFENLQDQLHEQDQAVQSRFSEAVQLLDDLCKKARTLAHEMASEQSQFSLKPAITEMIHIINQTGELEAELSVFGLEKPIGATIENAVFHILRELIGNCLKHAEASRLFIQLTQHEDNLNIIVEDNGLGFDPKSSMGSGMGLSNLDARIQKLDGLFTIDTELNRGTSVSIDIPLPETLSPSPTNSPES